jgi:probable rRNA maturation factor
VIIIERALEGVSQQSLARFATRAQKLAGVEGDVTVLITGSRQVQQLNRKFRRKNKPTDVLSFPREDGGDIAICAQIAQSNATRFGHPAVNEIKVLILHGMLHLAGYDHETDNGLMEKKEARLRAKLKLPASLIQRTLKAPKNSTAAMKGAKRKIAAKKSVHSTTSKQTGPHASSHRPHRGAVNKKRSAHA